LANSTGVFGPRNFARFGNAAATDSRRHREQRIRHPHFAHFRHFVRRPRGTRCFACTVSSLAIARRCALLFSETKTMRWN
jgi:hypothetical protein